MLQEFTAQEELGDDKAATQQSSSARFHSYGSVNTDTQGGKLHASRFADIL
jgi:hypothetical protein